MPYSVCESCFEGVWTYFLVSLWRCVVVFFFFLSKMCTERGGNLFVLVLGWVFSYSKECLDGMYTSRQRNCPTCATRFGKDDILQIFL